MEADFQRSQETYADLTPFCALRPVEFTLELPSLRDIFRRRRPMRRGKLSPARGKSPLDRELPKVQIVQRSLFNSPLGTAFRRKETNLRRNLPAISLPVHTRRSQSVQKSTLGKMSFSLQKQEASRVMYYFPVTEKKGGRTESGVFV